MSRLKHRISIACWRLHGDENPICTVAFFPADVLGGALDKVKQLVGITADDAAKTEQQLIKERKCILVDDCFRFEDGQVCGFNGRKFVLSFKEVME